MGAFQSCAGAPALNLSKPPLQWMSSGFACRSFLASPRLSVGRLAVSAAGEFLLCLNATIIGRLALSFPKGSEKHTSELPSRLHLRWRPLPGKKKQHIV